jgi:hypothetical protein
MDQEDHRQESEEKVFSSNQNPANPPLSRQHVEPLSEPPPLQHFP